jgi:hypothetical protein
MASSRTTPILDSPPGGGSAAVRYPADLGTPPFEKWMLFEVKAARHVTRNGILGVASEKGDNLDSTIKTVALYLPPDALNSSLSVTWQEDEYGSLAGAAIAQALQTGTSAKQPASKIAAGDKIPDLVKSIGMGAAGGVASSVLTGLRNMAEGVNVEGQVNTKAVIGGLSGTTTNPRTDIFFNSVSYRTHQFGFILVPRSIKEARAIDEILNIFQFYMLPSFGGDDVAKADSAFIGYPYEFVISMFTQHNGSQHHINTIDRSVLESITINHASNSRVSFVDEYGGNEYFPASTTISLQFKEVRLQGRNQQTAIWRGTKNEKPSKYTGNQNDPRGGEGLDNKVVGLIDNLTGGNKSETK